MVQHPVAPQQPACLGCSKGRKRRAEGEGAQIKGVGKGGGTLPCPSCSLYQHPPLPLGMEHLWP